MDIAESLSESVGLPMVDTMKNVLTHVDNAGVLVLVETLPPHFTPCINNYAKNIWFHEEIVKQNIKLFKIGTVEKLEGLFTKGLPFTTFDYIQNKFMDW